MRSTKLIRAAKISYILVSLLFCVLGLLMILRPNLSGSVIGIVAGCMLIAFGIVKLVGYFSRDLYSLAFQFDMAFGILLMALGAILIAHADRAMIYLCLVLGISIMADGLFKLQTALDARRFGLKSWWLILTLGILAGLIGIVAAFHPAQSATVLVVLLGVSMLAEGMLNLSVALLAVKTLRNQRAGTIEVEWNDEK